MSNYSDEVIRRFRKEDPQVKCRNITFQVTDDCCLKCSYCYQTHKGHAMMTKETAKKIVDLLFRLYDEDNDDMVINHHTKGLVLDFIGGEPLMNVDVIEYTIDYFINQCAKKDHIWLTNFRTSMSSNGILYFEPRVQEFLNKYQQFISLNITIDGPKEVHDLCRVDYDGKGSFDRAIAAWDDWFKRTGEGKVGTKVTIAPENLPYMESIFDFFISRGCKSIHANPIFEHEWTTEEAKVYYKILIKLADRLLDETNVTSSLFREMIGTPLSSRETHNYCGGTSAMLAFDPQGNAYPCLRYMESSLDGKAPPIIIGNTDGIYNTPEYKAIYDDMKAVTRQSQSSQECLDCPVACCCAWCFPAGTKINTPKGQTNIEDVHIGDVVYDMYGNTQTVENNMSHISTDLVAVHAAGFKTIYVTSEHPFYCKPVIRRQRNLPVYGEPQWVEAKNLKTTDRIALYVPKFGTKDIDKNFAYIIGRYIGDGWKTASGRKTHPYRYYICTAFDEQEEFENYLNNSGITYTKTQNRTVTEYNLNISNNEYLVSLLDDCGVNAKTKKVPQEVWNWNKESIIALLNGYFAADGCIGQDKKQQVQRFTSISYELILNICELVRGIYHKNPSITYRKSKGISIIEGRTVNNSDSFEGRFYLGEPVRHYYEYDEENNIMWVNVKQQACDIPESLQVYNLTVSNTHTYIANGAIVHNCSAANYMLTGSYNKRTMNICWMHRAVSLANVYYWNLKYRHERSLRRKPLYLPRNIATQIITDEQYDELLDLAHI